MNKIDMLYKLHNHVDIVLCKEDLKAAFHKEWDKKILTIDQATKLIERYRCNIAVRLRHGLMCWDQDSGEKPPVESPWMVRSPKGGTHVYMRHDLPGQKTILHPDGKPYDLKFTGYVVHAPSIVQGRPYELLCGPVPIHELPLFPRELLPKPKVPNVKAVLVSGDMVERARAYLLKIPGTVCGRGECHRIAFRVACVLCVKFGLSVDEAYPVFMEWSAKSSHQWTETELLHKLHDAAKKRET